jgi:hypothetical protein
VNYGWNKSRCFPTTPRSLEINVFDQSSITNVWFTITAWSTLYIIDYYLTVYAARLYKAGAHNYLLYGGSYELTPQFQSDIDNLRNISPRFVFHFALSNVIVILAWFLCIRVLPLPELFAVFVGGLILREAVIILRHVRNITLFEYAQNPAALKGRLEFSRWLVLKQSAIDLMSFAGLFLFIYAMVTNWFFLGGALGCSVVAQQQWALAKAARSHLHNA